MASSKTARAKWIATRLSQRGGAWHASRQMRPSLRTGFAFALLLCANACAYRHHTTPLQTVPNPPRTSQEWPAGVYGLRLQQAEARQVKLSGLAWDDDGTLPDVFLRLFVDGRQIWQ